MSKWYYFSASCVSPQEVNVDSYSDTHCVLDSSEIVPRNGGHRWCCQTIEECYIRRAEFHEKKYMSLMDTAHGFMVKAKRYRSKAGLKVDNRMTLGDLKKVIDDMIESGVSLSREIRTALHEDVTSVDYKSNNKIIEIGVASK